MFHELLSNDATWHWIKGSSSNIWCFGLGMPETMLPVCDDCETCIVDVGGGGGGFINRSLHVSLLEFGLVLLNSPAEGLFW